MATGDVLAVALSAQLQLGGGLDNDGLATLTGLPDPLVLHVMRNLDGPDLARLAAGNDQRLVRLAVTDALWKALCLKRWGAACNAEVLSLYGGSWYACFAARNALPARLLSCYDRAAALVLRLEAAAAPPGGDQAALREDGAALAQTAWASSMFLCNSTMLANGGAANAPTAEQVAAWAQSPEHAAFREHMLRAVCSPAGTAAVCAYLDHAVADATEYDMWGGRGFDKFEDVPMRRSAAEFLLHDASLACATGLSQEAAAAVTARLTVLDNAITAAAAQAHRLSNGAPAALPNPHATRWWQPFSGP